LVTQWFPDAEARLVADPESGSAAAPGEGIARFRDPGDRGQATAPSLALIKEPRDVGPLPTTWRTRAIFGRVNDLEGGHRAVRVPIEPGTSLYGTGEVPGPLVRNGSRTVGYNRDAWEYDLTDEALYQTHPWVLAVRPDGTAFGVLADTTFRVEIDLTTDIRFTVDLRAEPFCVYIIERDEPQAVVTALAALTGRMPMPPLWALGYQQSRWSYDSEQRALELAGQFRSRRIPCDVIWFDIDSMDGFRCFTTDRTRFPSPETLNARLHDQGFKTVWIINPGIKVDPEYRVYREGREEGLFLLDSRGQEYHGSVWPGPCAFPDFTRAPTRLWWAGLCRDFLAQGIDGVWNDMNEPAVFDNEDKEMPGDNRHRADPQLGGPGEHRRYHNVYGMLMAHATREGMLAARPDRRPFVLTRSNYLGGQRYAATWTGDNSSTWEHLAWSIPMALNLSLSGQPFCGADIGGFAGNCEERLFARWMGIGALLPFARGHSIKDSRPHEPWEFGPACEGTSRRAIERRYRLLPYLYTLFRRAVHDGEPIVRPLFFADPADPALRGVDDSFLLGPDLLVRASTRPDGAMTSPVPRGVWRAFDTAPLEDGESDPNLPQMLFRGGSIVPMGPVLQFVGERSLDPLTLIITPDPAGSAAGTLYEDAGDGWEFRDGHFRLSTYRAVRGADTIRVELVDSAGRMHRPERALEAILLLDGGRRVRASGRDGKPLTIPLPPL
jgi:alpha-glucosidase